MSGPTRAHREHVSSTRPYARGRYQGLRPARADGLRRVIANVNALVHTVRRGEGSRAFSAVTSSAAWGVAARMPPKKKTAKVPQAPCGFIAPTGPHNFYCGRYQSYLGIGSQLVDIVRTVRFCPVCGKKARAPGDPIS